MKCTLYKILKYSLKPLYLLLFRPKYIGVNNIPKKGAFVMAGNHTSGMDALMMVSTPRRVIHVLSKKELFNNKFKNWFFRNMACIPVDRKIHDDNAKIEVINCLKEGHAIGIFPEGTISPNDLELLPFKKGTVSFAYNVKCPIVPFAIIGKYRIFRKGLTVKYGKPYYVKSNNFEKETEKLRNIVLKLKNGEDDNE